MREEDHFENSTTTLDYIKWQVDWGDWSPSLEFQCLPQRIGFKTSNVGIEQKGPLLFYQGDKVVHWSSLESGNQFLQTSGEEKVSAESAAILNLVSGDLEICQVVNEKSGVPL